MKTILCIILIFCCLNISYSKSIEKIVAKINDQIITQSQLEEFFQFAQNDKKNTGEITKEKILDYLIEFELMFQLASEYNISISDKEIEETINIHMKKNGIKSIDLLIDKLKKSGINNLDLFRYQIKIDRTRQNVVRFIIVNHFIDEPSQNELIELYNKEKENFKKKEQVKIGHIFVQIDSNEPSSTWKLKHSLLQNIIKDLKLKKDTFGNMAFKYSQDSETKYKGGIIGWRDLDEITLMNPDFAKLAFNLKKGDITDSPIWSDKGIHIFKIIDKRKARTIPFAEARKILYNQIRFKRSQDYLKRLLENKRKKSIILKFLKY